jgi:hypothetical protein
VVRPIAQTSVGVSPALQQTCRLELQLAGPWKKQYMLHAAALVLTAWAALILLEEIEAEI